MIPEPAAAVQVIVRLVPSVPDSVGAAGAAGGPGAKPRTAIRGLCWATVHEPVLAALRHRASSAMLHPADAPASSAFTSARMYCVWVLDVATSITTQYVVLAFRAMPVPGAVCLAFWSPEVSVGFVSVPRLLPGPLESERMLTV